LEGGRTGVEQPVLGLFFCVVCFMEGWGGELAGRRWCGGGGVGFGLLGCLFDGEVGGVSCPGRDGVEEAVLGLACWGVCLTARWGG